MRPRARPPGATPRSTASPEEVEAVLAAAGATGPAVAVWVWTPGFVDGDPGAEPLAHALTWVARTGPAGSPTGTVTAWQDPAGDGRVTPAAHDDDAELAAALGTVGPDATLVTDRSDWLVVTGDRVRSLLTHPRTELTGAVTVAEYRELLAARAAARPARPGGRLTPVPSAVAADRRSLGRALLARQHLLARHDGTVTDLVAHLVGMQAQAPWAPYTGVWTRLAGVTHADLADRLLDRTLVRIATLRGTIHLLTADDALVLPALTEPVLRRTLTTAQPYGARARGRRRGRGRRRRPGRRRGASRPGTAELGRRLARAVAGRRPEDARLRRPLHPAARAGAAARACGGGPARPPGPRPARGSAASPRTSPTRTPARRRSTSSCCATSARSVPASVADVQTWSGLTAPRPGARAAPSPAGDRPRRARSRRAHRPRAVRPAGRPATRPGHARPRSASCPSTTTCCSATPTAPAS